MLRPLATALLVLTLASAARADEHRLGYGLGLVHQQVREELIRPFRWDGFGGALDLAWTWRMPADRVAVELRLPAALVTNRYGDGSGATGFRLDAGWERGLGRLAGGAFALGARLRGEEHLLYSFDWDEEHLYWLTAWDLGPSASWRRPLAPGHAVELELAIPVVALVSRPPTYRFDKIEDLKNPGFYFTGPHAEVRATSLHEHQAFTARGAWHWSFSESWDFDVALELAFRRHAEPLPAEWLGFTILPGFRHAL